MKNVENWHNWWPMFKYPKKYFFCQLEEPDYQRYPCFTCVKIKRFLPNRWSKFLPELIFVADNNLGKLRSGDRLCRGGQTRWHRWCLELGQSTEMENSFVRSKKAIWVVFGNETSFSQTRGKYLQERITFAIPWTKRSGEDYHQSYCEKPKQPLESSGARYMGPSMEASTVAEWREVVHYLEFPRPLVPVLPRPMDWKYVYF